MTYNLVQPRISAGVCRTLRRFLSSICACRSALYSSAARACASLWLGSRYALSDRKRPFGTYDVRPRFIAAIPRGLPASGLDRMIAISCFGRYEMRMLTALQPGFRGITCCGALALQQSTHQCAASSACKWPSWTQNEYKSLIRSLLQARFFCFNHSTR